MAADAGNVVASAAAEVRCQQRIRTQRRIAAQRHVDQDDVAFRTRDDAKAQSTIAALDLRQRSLLVNPYVAKTHRFLDTRWR
jgi:hypothetical protein